MRSVNYSFLGAGSLPFFKTFDTICHILPSSIIAQHKVADRHPEIDSSFNLEHFDLMSFLTPFKSHDQSARH